MALSARELLLVMRARDEASRVIRGVGGTLRTLGGDTKTAADKMQSIGTAMMTVGAGLTATGAAALSFFNDATSAAADYQKATALTLTQTSGLNTNLAELSQIGKDVAKEVPLAFSEMQEGLFDIFSTIDTTVPEAAQALELLAKAAVAGDAPLRSVARTGLAALNAWQMPVEDLNRVLDTQFKLVEFGVGTYDEFASSIGRGIPAAVSANQDLETLAGTLAFLTRNGLSTSQATTSAARAFELFSTPKAVNNLEALGITVKNSNGEFVQMNDLITQLATNQGWAAMTSPERKTFFEETFGKGSIQARRFFDVAIPNWKAYNNLVNVMLDAEGAMDNAYQIMFETPISKMQLMRNEYEILKTEIGDRLLPAKLKLLEALTGLIDRWNALSPAQQDMIVKFAAIAAVVMTVVGVILLLVGGALLFVGTILPMLGGAAALAKGFVIVSVVIALLIAAFILLRPHWDLIKEKAIATGEAIGAFFSSLPEHWESFKAVLGEVTALMSSFFELIKTKSGEVSETLAPAWEAFRTAAGDAWEWVKEKASEFWEWLSSTFGPGIKDIMDTVIEAFSDVQEAVEKFKNSSKKNWDEIKEVILAVWDLVTLKTRIAWDIIKSIFLSVLPPLVDLVKALFNTMKEHVSVVMGAMADVITAVWNVIVAGIKFNIILLTGIIRLGLAVLRGDWSAAWDAIKDIAKAAWNLMVAIVKLGWALIKASIAVGMSSVKSTLRAGWEVVKFIFKAAWEAIKAAVKAGVRAVETSIRTFKRVIIAVFNGASTWLRSAGKAIVEGLIGGIKAMAQRLKNTAASMASSVTSAFKGALRISSPSRVMMGLGQDTMRGFENGLGSGWKDIERFLENSVRSDAFTPDLRTSAPTLQAPVSFEQSELLAILRDIRDQGEAGTRRGLVVEGDLVLGDASPDEAVEKLDLWASSELAGV